MWETLILAGVCVVLLAMLYAVSGAWKTHPGVKGFFRWTAAQLRLRAAGPGSPRNAVFLADRARWDTAGGEKPSDARLAIQVLEEMYQEWDQRSRHLEARIQALETAVAQLTAEVDKALHGAGHDRDNMVGKDCSPKRSAALSDLEIRQEAALHSAAEKRERASPAAAVDSWTHDREGARPRAQASREMLYFSILDLLHEGRSRDEIRDLLGVSTDEIARVEKLLSMAECPESGVH